MSKNFTMEDLSERLAKGRYKMTLQRKTILQVFLNHPGEHLSAEDVYKDLKDKGSDIGLATVYRSLELLNEVGILQKMNFEDFDENRHGCFRYEISAKDPLLHQHHHLICVRCNKVTEFDDDLLEDLEEKITQRLGFKVTDHQLKFFGICKECQDAEENQGN